MKQYTVDAFTDRVFGGNPAAVCVADAFPSEDLMRNIAKENNLSETAFVVPQGDAFALRWFTPECEIDLCGHATLATAFVIDRFVAPSRATLDFHTRSGILRVRKQGGRFAMDFPAFALEKIDIPAHIGNVLGIVPQEAYLGRDLLCVFEDEAQIRAAQPDFAAMLGLDGVLLHITAPGKDYDCVSRSFAPKHGVNEDPVCGSGHCHIFPYWAERLGKSELVGHQASKRGGVLHGQVGGGRVVLSGSAVLFAQSEIFV
ncbi:phenazine biosynthesis protein [Eikenella longinqua]|uniref:Phenazine biosynthesis protein n=1 Tax=Eikenella longinqua TaxID=1795827 RepID=A0A1A9S213_9NEIS|nr:phenazine biosynthesis protein [Eikenella longinqua]